MRYFLCLGSNLGDRKDNLAQALNFLEKEGIDIIKESSLYETQPVDFPSESWFYNQVVEIEADLKPEALLTLIKIIEKKMGRDIRTRKGSRVIDIDIILVENVIVQTNGLEIPHPRLKKRNFVLVPFAEISPDTVHPLLNMTVKDLLKKSDDRSVVKLVE